MTDNVPSASADDEANDLFAGRSAVGEGAALRSARETYHFYQVAAEALAKKTTDQNEKALFSERASVWRLAAHILEEAVARN